jgi:uncharacterized protein YcbX
MLGTITQVWRYPVKSMQGHRVDHLDVGPGGAADDRRWAVVDPAAGRVLSAKRWPALLQATARWEGDDVVVVLPGGDEVVAGDPAADAAASAWLGRDVAFARPDPGAALPFVMGTDPTDDASADFEWAGPPGTWLDLADVHLLTTTSLATAAALAPGSVFDIRRFRPTVVVDTDDHAAAGTWPEDDWVGAPVRLGGATIEGFMRTVRCAMPTRAQPGLDADPEVSRALQRQHGNDLGLYANVPAGGSGRLAVGDAVALC